MKLRKVLSVCLLLFLFVTGCGKKENNEIKIGVIQPLSGELAYFGKKVLNGIQLAADDYKDSLSNKKIDLIVEDSKGEPTTAVSDFNKLISINNVKMVIGCLTSSSTLAIAPIAMKNKILLMSPTASNPALSNAGKYFFRVWPSDSFAGRITADYSFKELHCKTAFVLYINNDYGVGLKDVFKKEFEKLGGKVLFADSYTQEQSNFRSILIKAKRMKVNLIYIPGHPYGIANALKQAKELGIKATFISDVAAEDKQIVNVAGTAAVNLYYVTVAFDTGSNEGTTVRFIRQYKSKYNEMPDVHSVKGYEAMSIILKGLKKGISSSNKMVEFLKTRTFDTISGKISFDKNGDVISNMAVKKYNSKLKVETIENVRPH